MGALILLVQIIMFGNSFWVRGYLVLYENFVKKYKTICVIVNSVAIILEIIFFTRIDILKTIVIVSIMSLGIILSIFECVARKKFFSNLTQRVMFCKQEANGEPTEIRRMLLEKFETSYSIKDIEKVLRRKTSER